MRRLPVTLGAALAIAAVFATGGYSATKPGVSIALASARIEFNVRLVDTATVASATERLRLARQLGGPHGIAQAEADLKMAKDGLEVDHASCLGTKPAPGGYVAFRCKLTLSDNLGSTGKALGTYQRLVTGKWAWKTASYSGYGPPGWD